MEQEESMRMSFGGQNWKEKGIRKEKEDINKKIPLLENKYMYHPKG